MEHARCPYSQCAVGCVIQCAAPGEWRRVFGANMESAALSLSICAERIAVWQAAYLGIAQYAEVMVIVSNTKVPRAPCGACRQIMKELLPGDCKVVSANLAGGQRKWKVANLLPD